MRKTFLERFANRIKELGFDRKKSDYYFRSTEHGICGAMVGASKHYGAMRVSVNAFVRIDALETLMEEFYFKLWERKVKSMFSATANVGNIRASAYQTWDIYDESEIDASLDELVEMFKVYGLPYLERFSDPMRLYNGLLENHKKSWLLGGDIGSRWQEALALTMVMNRFDLFEITAQEGLKFLPGQPQARLDEFTQLVDWLKLKFEN